MLFEVLLTEDAARDLEEIYDYIAEQDAPHAIKRIGVQNPERASMRRTIICAATVPRPIATSKAPVALTAGPGW